MDDLIRRSDVMPVVESALALYLYEYDAIANRVNAIPAIDPESLRARGKWIERPYLLGTSRFCSLCGRNYGMPHEVYNYCPNCGARMDGER